MDYKPEPVCKPPRISKEKERDIQQGRMILAVKNYLFKEPLPTSLKVLWDHEHDAESDQKAEEPTLYTGEKNRGRGTICRNGAVDVMVRNEQARTVELLIEVEPNLDPKRFWGDVGAAMDSDRHVPSYLYCDDWNAGENKHSYWLSETLLVFVTVCGADKEEQLKGIASRIRERFSIPNAKIPELIICTGRSEEQALANFRQLADRIVFDRS